MKNVTPINQNNEDKVDTTMMPLHIVDALSELCGQNDDAVALMQSLWYVSQVWDDAVDGEGEPYRVSDAFETLLVRIPANPFYRRHMHQLTPMMSQTILNWHTSNTMEDKQEGEDINRAYMLRASMWQLFHYIIMLNCGMEWAKTVGHDLWSLYGETLEQFQKEMTDG